MENEHEFIKNYNIKKYEQPSAAADIALFTVKNVPDGNYRKLDEKKLCLLMIKRLKPPFADQYALPGGFAKKNETVDDTALRELFEETAVENIQLYQLKTTSTPNRDPRGWIISCGYLALADSSLLTPKGGDDAAEAVWFDVTKTDINTVSSDKEKITSYKLNLSYEDNIRLSADITERISLGDCGRKFSVTADNSCGIAFDHGEIIAYALNELKRKTIYEGAAFSLLPEMFTVSDLKSVYETITGTKDTNANFRRKINRFILPTEYTSSGAGHRPSKLFKKNYNELLDLS